MVSNQQERVVKLAPPTISTGTIQEKLVCIRPMREAKPNISIETHGNRKSIVHCYGHGGSGWTMLFGSVATAIDLFLENNPSRDAPVRIVGAGCIGLLVAAELLRLGYIVAGITTRDLIDLPSWKAAGYFALISLRTSPEEADLVQEMGMASFIKYQEVHKGLHPYLPAEAVRWLPVFCHNEIDAGIEYLERRGLIPMVERVTLDFHGVRHKNYLKYMTYFINGSLMMQSLMREVKRHGVPVDIRNVRSFDEFSEETIFNCTGIGSRELNGDASMIPVKGHLITLTPAAGSGHMDYMLHTTVMQEGKKENLYLFPKSQSVSTKYPDGIACSGVLGGTFLVDDTVSDEVHFNKILERAKQFFGK